ncbi:nuclear transport factor 2 family protein [Actinospica durhamensis]|uniref:Nuclear transport factor 2 family protein n=1 Tax=Actinospica durhamensis TaxID=1508375 RepID=A0A941IPP1_9ACTN|nr:nuclear transport factor 2 family protein [Actinospica durhamensis]MBR7836760.1 nuclear transport factor 2 family protein [Actinospica durhamensis]
MLHELTTEDHRAIDRTLALAGHIFDLGELDRLEEIFTPEAVYDLSDVGAGTFEGTAAIRNGALALGAGNPIAHRLTNIVITGHEDDQATAQSKGLIIMADGSVGSVTHRDTLRLENGSWRISRRVILAQRTPLGGLHLTHAAER